MTNFIARALKGFAVAGAFAAVLAAAPKANAAEVIVEGPRGGVVAVEHGPVFAPGYGPVYGGPIYRGPVVRPIGWGYRGGWGHGWGFGGRGGFGNRGGFGGGPRGGFHGGGFHGGPVGHGRR